MAVVTDAVPATASPSKWRTFLRARFTREGAVGLYVTAGFFACVVVVVLFAVLADAVFDVHGKTSLDREVTLAIEGFHSPSRDRAARAVSFLGDHRFLLPATLAVVATLVLLQHRVSAVLFFGTVIGGWLLAQAGGLLALLVQLLLTLALAALLYAQGEPAAEWVIAFARRLAGGQGERAVRLSGQAIRAIALGIVVTALVQSLVGGIGLVVAGVPHATILTAVMFLLGVAQIGAVPVMVGAVIWLFWEHQMLWGSIMVVWTLITGTLDNFIRPILIKRGADLPLLLVFAGVLGGVLAFGIIGLFVGPVVLAVSYTLLVAWVDEDHAPES